MLSCRPGGGQAAMDFRFRRRDDAVEYLVLRASQEKADRWFGGGVFWQVPSHFVGDDSVVDAIGKELERFGLQARAVWVAEHAYTIYNRRYQSIVQRGRLREAGDPALGENDRASHTIRSL